jgi:hypothetical protein
MKKISLALLLLISWIAGYSQNEPYSRVRIFYTSERLPQLLSLGIDPEGSGKAGCWMICEISAHDVDRVRDAGFTVETLIDDVTYYYQDRNENPYKYPQEASRSMDCSGTQTIATPQHFRGGSMGGFCTLAEMLAQLDSMRLHYPNLISVKQAVGTIQTVGGRSLYYVKISDNPDVSEAEPGVLYSALTHAREPMGMQGLLFYMWYLLENYGSNPEITALVNNEELFFIPCVNPDGYEYNRSTNPSGGGTWRKNRKNNGGSYGIDLNRNYGNMWGYDNTGSSSVATDETYRGTAGFSEAETQAMKWFCENHSISTLIDYHCYSNLLIYPWSYLADYLTPDSNLYRSYSSLMVASNGYLAGTPSQTVGYTGNGGSIDWFYGEQSSKNKIMCWSPEAGDAADGFWPASSRIEDIAKVNVEQDLYVARFAGRYAQFTDNESRLLSQSSGFLNFSLQRLGLSASSFTLTLVPVSGNILSVGAPKTLSGMNVMELRNDSISYALSPSVVQGEELVFVMQIDNGLYTINDTLRKFYGAPVQVFSDLCANTTAWTAGGWAVSTSQYHSAPSSITDSPSGNYASNLNKSMTLSSTIDLSNKIYAQLNFWAKWDLENDYDYVQVKVSTDNGTTWTPLCGKYTNPGSSYQILNSPLYDGTQSGWVKEEIDLSDYLNHSIKLRFTLVSDGFTSGDGFYFDDIEVIALNQPVTGVESTGRENQIRIFPNPGNGKFHIELTSSESALLKIYSMQGRLIKSMSISDGNVDLEDVSSGMYLIIAEQNGKEYRGRIVVNQLP